MTLEHNALISIFLINNYALGYFPCFFQIYFGFLKNGQGFSMSKIKKSPIDLKFKKRKIYGLVYLKVLYHII
jgi:hypothetical protein